MGSGRCLQSYIRLQVMGITHGCRFKAFLCLVFQSPKLRPSFILFKYTIHIYKCHLISYYFYQYFINIQWLHICISACFINVSFPAGKKNYLGQFFFFFFLQQPKNIKSVSIVRRRIIGSQ